MKPRFKPGQEVWTPSWGRALSVDVIEVIWNMNEVQYEVQTISDLGHQHAEFYEDTPDTRCLLFTDRETCENYIRGTYIEK